MKRLPKAHFIIGAVTAVSLTAVATAFATLASAENKLTGISVAAADTLLDSSDKVSGYAAKDGAEKKTEYYDVYDYDNLTLTLHYSNGGVKSLTGGAISRYEAQNGTLLNISDNQAKSPWGAGTHKVVYSLGGFSDTVNFTVAKNAVASISVKPLSDVKPLYHLSGEYRRTSTGSGGKTGSYFRYALEDYDYNVTIKYADGKSFTCPADELYGRTGYTAEFSHDEKELSAGKHTGYCTVNGVKGKFTFEVVKNGVKSLSLSFAGGTPTLKCPADGSYQTGYGGGRYFRYYYDRTAVRAKVTYTNGGSETMTLGELAYKLHGELELDDNQQTDPWLPGTNKIAGKINGVQANLPVNVAAAVVSGVDAVIFMNSAVVTWDPVPAQGYVVEQYTGGKWKTLYDVKYGTFSKQINGLSAGQKYLFGVRAYNTVNGKRTYTARKTAYTGTAPTKVTGLKLLDKTSTSLKLGWNKNTTADGYVIEVYGDGAWKAFPPIYHNYTVSYNLVGLKPNVDYKVQISSFVKGPGSLKMYSEKVSAHYKTDRGSLSVSGFKLAGRAANSVKLSWTKNTSADGYQLGIYKGGRWITYNIAGGSSQSFTVTGLSSAKKYSVRIRSYAKINGKTTYGAYKTGSVYTAPADMTGFKLAGRAANSVKLSWKKNPTASGYQLGIYKGGKWITYTIPSGGAVSYSVNGLSSGTRYSVRVRAYKNLSGKTIYGKYKTGSVYTAPADMTGFKLAGRAADSVKLSWKKNPTASGYQLGIYKGGKWITYTLKGGGTVSYTLTGLQTATKYNVRVRAYKNLSGKTIYGKYKTGSVYTAPADMTGFKLSDRTSGSVKLSWKKNPTASGYQLGIYRSGKWTTCTLKNSGTVSYTLTGLQPASKYNVRIRAYRTINGRDFYGTYKTGSVYTAPAKVSGVKTLSAAKTSLKVGWSRSPSVSGYQIEIFRDGKWESVTVKGGSSVSCTLTGLQAGTQYNVRVRAYKTLSDKTIYGEYANVALTTGR